MGEVSGTAWAVALLLLGAAVALAVWRLLRPRPLPPHLEETSCSACGWKGTVSRYAGRCPACAAPVGEQRARRAGR